MSRPEAEMDAELSDASARRRALDPEISCIVRAPAGSGKTELLIQRFLVMLARVKQPGEVLAITFTRKAAAEMRERVVGALSAAAAPPEGELSEHQRTTRALAQAVLKRDIRQKWNILQAPAQLRIQTIDSLNAELVRRMPWLSRLGALPRVSDFPQQHYQDAVRSLLFTRRLDSSTRAAVDMLLAHLDNRADIMENMLIDLLARRDQWMRHILADPEQMRAALEESLANKVEEILTQAQQQLDSELKHQLHRLTAYAACHCADDASPVCAYASSAFPSPVASELPQWQALASMLLTAQGQWRKRVDKNSGFPPGRDAQSREMKNEALEVLETLRDSVDPGLWHEVKTLPPPHYASSAWEVLHAMLVVLPRLVAQLWVEFRARTEADFTEIALSARQALVESGNPTDLLLQLDQQIEHILVDEFQDTSWLQFSLLETLTSAWDEGRGRTLFIVGDPMQSIYRFREAEVGLFLRADSEGIGQIRLVPLQLTLNFRSQGSLVELANQWFRAIFPSREHAGSGAVRFTPAVPIHPPDDEALKFVPMAHSDLDTEAQAVVGQIKKILASSSDESIAILVRSRSHLGAIIPLLQRDEIEYQAQDIEPLKDDMLVRDAVSVLKTLIHPADKLSWMSVLRAPWCGLTLVDLSYIARFSTLAAALKHVEDMPDLSEDGRTRFAHVGRILVHYQHLRGRLPLRRLCEECLVALKVQQCWSSSELEVLEQLGTVLERCDRGGDVENFVHLEQQLDQLYARAQGGVGTQIHVMTIHKAKGLEFDHVFLPGLGRKSRGSSKSLLRWEEDPHFGLLLAPVAERGAIEPDPVYAMLGRMEKRKEEYESARLLYVAATRARKKLYCYAHAPLDASGTSTPASGSLLELMWPVCQPFFASVPVDETMEEENVEKVAESLLKRMPQEHFPAYSSPETEGESSGIQQSSAAHRPFASELRRSAVVGTVVHEYLAYLCVDTVRQQREYIHSLRQGMVQRFALEGYTQEADSLAATCIDMLERSIESKIGRWILKPYPDASAEFEVCGVSVGESVIGVVDRTFVDPDTNERWIVDYKSAIPESGERLEAFCQRQGEVYAPQLERYRTLMQQLEPGRCCRAGLYFPACDAWCEI
ncbi:MAG: UvrD-helicase domain-containing protein [Desulfuromonadaceae bacterium]|nr:UvrD-helicase domain-containing protein [Geobacteraceae bacterium]